MTSGTIIPLAWPETPVIQEGKWYDGIMRVLGFLNDGFYKAGHAAMLIINHETKEVLYFDFGRYQTPKKHGRVRDKFTDPDIELAIKAEIKGKKIVNLPEILKYLSNIEATHGEGRLVASEMYTERYERVFRKAKKIQNREAIKYGPFNIGGSNCSRFVTQSCRLAKFNPLKKFLIIK